MFLKWVRCYSPPLLFLPLRNYKSSACLLQKPHPFTNSLNCTEATKPNLRQDQAGQPSWPQGSSHFCLPSAGVSGVCHTPCPCAEVCTECSVSPSMATPFLCHLVQHMSIWNLTSQRSGNHDSLSTAPGFPSSVACPVHGSVSFIS